MRIPLGEINYHCTKTIILDARTRDNDSEDGTSLKTGLLLSLMPDGYYREYEPSAENPQDCCVAVLAEDVELRDYETKKPMAAASRVFWYGLLPESQLGVLSPEVRKAIEHVFKPEGAVLCDPRTRI